MSEQPVVVHEKPLIKEQKKYLSKYVPKEGGSELEEGRSKYGDNIEYLFKNEKTKSYVEQRIEWLAQIKMPIQRK